MARGVGALALLICLVSVSACSDISLSEPGGQPTLVSRVHARFTSLQERFQQRISMERHGAVFRAGAGRAASTGHGWRRPGPHELSVELPARAAGLTRISSGPVQLELRSVGARDVSGTPDQGLVVYRGVFAGADSLHVAVAQRVEEFVLLRDAIRAPRRFVYQLALTRGGGRVRQLDGTVEVLDAAGVAWLRLDPPFVEDSAGRRHMVKVSLRQDRMVLTLPDRARDYPLLLDPGWRTTGSMTGDRAAHTATLLSSGKVLVAGGMNTTMYSTASAELYDPKTGTWTKTASMKSIRVRHTATLLPSGKVLVTGGMSSNRIYYGDLYYGCSGGRVEAELYDPQTGLWSATGSMAEKRAWHTATLLNSGKVLVAGTCHGSKKTELYDPKSGSFSSANSMRYGRWGHTANRLPNGDVLLVGGSSSDVYPRAWAMYYPSSNKWTWICAGACTCSSTSSNYAVPCTTRHGSTFITPKHVLITGGIYGTKHQALCWAMEAVGYGSWKGVAAMSKPRINHASVELEPGKVLVTGGFSVNVNSKTTELFDLKSNSWSARPSMTTARGLHSLTRLPSGLLLAAGGVDANQSLLATAELFDPTSGDKCKKDSECASGHCVDGICCESACTQTCRECAIQKVGGWSVGRCANIAAGKPDLSATQICSGAKLCDGKGACNKGNGQHCSAGSDCGSGHCVDGVCCASSCSGSCQACNLPGKLGSCNPVPANSPDKIAASPCSGSKACDGKGSCRAAPGQPCSAGGACSSGICADKVCCKTSCHGTCRACDLAGSAGTCTLIAKGQDPAKECPVGYACNGKGACRKLVGRSCTLYSDCISGFCSDNVCCASACQGLCKTCKLPKSPGTCGDVPAGQADLGGLALCKGTSACDGKGGCKLAAGQSCSLAAECASGYCGDGYCCDEACASTCQACNLPGKLGSCSPVPAGRPDKNATVACDNTKLCDGKGACKAAGGQSCSTDSQCSSGHCVDFTCCDESCSETCKACNVPGKLGTCSLVPAGQPDPQALTPCEKTRACDGLGNCKLMRGQACSADIQCASDHCVDGVCCDSTCDKTCESCAVKGNAGTCTAVPANTNPDKECVGVDPKCGGVCNGKRQCQLPGSGTVCGLCKACNGAGRCAVAPPDDPACGIIDCDKLDTECRDHADLESQRCAGFGKCKPPNTPATCSKQTSTCTADSGAETPDAGSGGQLAPDKEGCSCAAGAGGVQGAGLLLPLMLGLLAAWRRRIGGRS